VKTLPAVLIWVALLLWCSEAVAKNQKLDIILEGPWIYYQDANYNDGTGTPKAVLVAMAPNTGHYYPTFTTGHGTTFPSPGVVYCVGYGNTCATGSGTLGTGNSPKHPDLQLIDVKTPQSWVWYANLADDYWYLILPMPNSASNDGVDYMFLEKTFQTPVSAGTDPQYSIGLQLHYDSWPSDKVSLIYCTDPGAVSTADKCENPRMYSDQTQYGTLRISMTGLEETGTAKQCNYHLRAAYNRMILFLDNTSLDSGNNVNANKEYIDLRSEDTDDYDAACYFCDPQHPDASCSQMLMGRIRPKMDAKSLLADIIHDLTPLDHLDKENEYGLQLKGLKEISAEVTGRFPTPPQLVRIKRLLDLSIRGVQYFYQKEGKVEPRKQIEGKEPLLAPKVAGEERQLLDYINFSSTSGKDCKAAQMLITSN
jgi:hypothetical protein